MKSPFKYAGGKYYARKYLDKHLIESDVYCEPFVGGGSIFFHKNKSRINILNDLDNELINTYKIIRDYKDDMIDILGTFDLPSKEAYIYYKDEYIATNEVEEASRWYYLNRCTYGGITCKTNMSYSYNYGVDMDKLKWSDIIIKASDKLQGVELRCQDGIDCINSLPDNTFVYIDPPYILSSQKTLYEHYYELSEHYDLADCIKENMNRLHIMITLDDCEISRDLYGFMNRQVNESWCYKMDNNMMKNGETLLKNSRHKGQSKVATELIILNY